MSYPYQAITGRPRWRWPGDNGLAVYVAIGVEDYRFGDGHTEDLLPDVPQPDHVNTAWRDYGNRVGAFRLLDRLTELGVPPTVLLNTDVYDTAAEVTVAARKAGAEFVGHGRSNSDSLAGMSMDDERNYLLSVADRIAGEEGVRPQGWSSPWLAHTTGTVDALAGTGYRYLLDLRFDDQPCWLRTQAAPLLSIPYPLELNDSTTMIGRGTGAGEFADMIIDEFEEMVLAAAEQPLVLGIVVHSFISGVPFRLRQLTRALRHLRAAEGVWFTQPREIAAVFAAEVPPP